MGTIKKTSKSTGLKRVHSNNFQNKYYTVYYFECFLLFLSDHSHTKSSEDGKVSFETPIDNACRQLDETIRSYQQFVDSSPNKEEKVEKKLASHDLHVPNSNYHVAKFISNAFYFALYF